MGEANSSAPSISVIICTFRRDDVLVQTIEHLMPQCEAMGAELLVIDQLADHPVGVQRRLDAWHRADRIRYVNLTRSGLTHARNAGARMARAPVLVYFDDDILPARDTVQSHLRNYSDPSVAAVAGQVLDLGKSGSVSPGSFSHIEPVEQFNALYGGNFSIRRDVYWAIGGSDENLSVHAYTEDTILAHRLANGGHRIRYDPAASVVHLLHPSGGCRLNDESQPTDESEKSFSKLYWMFVATHMPWTSRRRLLWEALRHGPLRRPNVMNPWRQPKAWLGFTRATVKAYRKARDCGAVTTG
jgi:GT2 family glycosyltransferase